MYKRIMRWGAFCSHTLLHVHTIYMIVTSRVSSHSSLIHAFHSAIKMPNQACSYLIQAVGRCIMNRPRLMFQSIASKLPPLALQVSIWSFALTEIDLFFLTDARCSCPDMLEVLIMRGEWHHFQLASRSRLAWWLLRVDLPAPSSFQVLIPKVNEAVCVCVCVEAASTLESGHWQRRVGTILFLFWCLFVEGCGLEGLFLQC